MRNKAHLLAALGAIAAMNHGPALLPIDHYRPKPAPKGTRYPFTDDELIVLESFDEVGDIKGKKKYLKRLKAHYDNLSNNLGPKGSE